MKTYPPKGRILAVDSPASLRILTDFLESEAYVVSPEADGEAALRAAAAEPPDLLIVDAAAAGLAADELCRRLRGHAATRDLPLILADATDEAAERGRHFAAGAADCLAKPYLREEVLARVRTHVELGGLRRTLQRMTEQRSRFLDASERRLRSSLYDSISAVAATVEMRDPYTAGHQHRTALLAVAIARELELPEYEIEGIYLAGIVHDVGKVKVPVEILCKPGRLSGVEAALIREHPHSGYEILKAIDLPWPIAEIVLQHHERPDGSGYPRGLKGDDVLLEAQILAVADVVEAMISDRPYRAGLGMDAAFAEVAARRNSAYRDTIVDACVKVIRDKGFAFSP